MIKHYNYKKPSKRYVTIWGGMIISMMTAVSAHAYEKESIQWNSAWPYASCSVIHSGTGTLYHTDAAEARNLTVCINAGHGTAGGSSVTTLCHPDGSPKVTGGTTAEGQTEAVAVSTGMTFMDGTPEAAVTLELAQYVRDVLLNDGYDVLMVRDGEDVQLDNVARTVMANQMADCHIALHYDATETDKGVFYLSVPSDEAYRKMEPVASYYMEHNRLGSVLVNNIAAQGMLLFEGGALEMDLTQTSYSTVPSVDLEVGDRISPHTETEYAALAEGIRAGVTEYFYQK